MKKIVLTLLAFCLSTLPLLAQVNTSSPAPDFTLTDTNGAEHRLSDFKGKYIVLEWLNPDCPFVVKHYGGGNMQQLQKNYTEKGVIWLSINSSAPGKQGHYAPSELNDWAKRSNVAATAILLDGSGQVGQLYGAKTTPHMFIINPEGVLIYQGAIDSINSADPAVISNAQNYVRSALDEAMSGKPVTVPATKAYGCSVKY